MRSILTPEPGRQLEHFGAADEAHFRWQTAEGYFGRTERELVLALDLPRSGSLLEIGCGQGNNLFHLGARPGWVGVDFSPAKVEFARSALPGVSFFCADAGRLPFRDGAFEAVLIRDLLHHVPDRMAVVAEAARVLAPGGMLGVIEPNGLSPMVLAQALLVPAERGALRSHASRLKDELAAAGLRDVEVRRAQPIPLARLLHPKIGLDRMAAVPGVPALLDAAESAAGWALPRPLWMYLVARAEKGG